MLCSLVMAAALWSGGAGGVELKIDSDTARIDPGRSVFLTLTLRTPKGVSAEPTDLRPRVRGFSLAEDFADEPETGKDGYTTKVVNWKLVPEPCADVYKVAPFAVTVVGGASFVAGPVYFEPPADRPSTEGGIEIDPKKDLPPLSWRLVAWCAAAVAGALLALALAVVLFRYVARRVREHLMSPIERAWVELDRLIKKGLPGRGKYKDFYVELTMVVRRYVQRKYGIRAPHLTTEEFFRELACSGKGAAASSGLREFLESADLVKFAGVEATPDMADAATDSARSYLKSDDSAGTAGTEVRR